MLGCVTHQCTVAAIITGHKQSYLKPGEHLYSQERGCAHYAAWQLLMLLYRCVIKQFAHSIMYFPGNCNPGRGELLGTGVPLRDASVPPAVLVIRSSCESSPKPLDQTAER